VQPIGRNIAEAVGVPQRQIVEASTHRRVLRDREVDLAIPHVERAAMHHADANALVTRLAFRDAVRRIALACPGEAGHRVQHGVIGEAELEVRAIDDVYPAGEQVAEGSIVPDGLCNHRVMIAGQEKHGAVGPARARPALSDLLPPFTARHGLVEEIPSA
jgi:hypothetical protein